MVRRIMEFTKADVVRLIGDAKTLRGLNPARFTDEKLRCAHRVGHPRRSSRKPGRDPRPAFKGDRDLRRGRGDDRPAAAGAMVLEGVVTNVAAFGAFVDIGVHQDGLVHVSALSNTFVKDPRAVVKPGDVVKVKVMDVDIPRKRISLTMRMSDEPGQARGGARPDAGRRDDGGKRPPNDRGPRPPAAGGGGGGAGGGALADALRRAQGRK